MRAARSEIDSDNLQGMLVFAREHAANVGAGGVCGSADVGARSKPHSTKCTSPSAVAQNQDDTQLHANAHCCAGL
jgi:hypothetical protein